jgi:hypothetical protein
MFADFCQQLPSRIDCYENITSVKAIYPVQKFKNHGQERPSYSSRLFVAQGFDGIEIRSSHCRKHSAHDSNQAEDGGSND